MNRNGKISAKARISSEKNCDGQIEGLVELANEIVNVVKNDLNTLDSQNMLQIFLQLINSFEEEIKKSFEKSKYLPKIQAVFQTNFEILTNFFVRCLQNTDSVKSSTVDNLNSCLAQLIQIANLEKGSAARFEMNPNGSNFATEEEFVFLINSLSAGIKDLTKCTRNCVKSVNNCTDSAMEHLIQCKTSAGDISSQLAFTQLSKSSQKSIKEKVGILLEKIEMLTEIRKEILTEIKKIDGFSTKFYEDAKVIFKKLKTLHAEKMAEIQKIPGNNFRSGTSVSPSHKKNNTSYCTGTTNTSGYSHVVNLSTAYPAAKQPSRNFNDEKSQVLPEDNTDNRNTGKVFALSRSSEHFNSVNRMLAMEKSPNKVNKMSLKKTYPNANANANVSNSSLNISSSGNAPFNTNASNTNIASGEAALISQINDLTGRNRELLQEIAKLHQVYIQTHSENELLKKENSELKPAGASSDSKIFCKGEKSKSLTRISAVPNITTMQNMKHSPHYNRDNTPTKMITGKSPMKISESGNLFKLAETVIGFIRQMSNLQEAICKKSPNILDLKKDFEIQKKEIIQMANDISKYNSSGNVHVNVNVNDIPLQGEMIINTNNTNNNTTTNNNQLLIKETENLRIEREELRKKISLHSEEIARINDAYAKEIGKMKSDYDTLLSQEKEKNEKLTGINNNLELVIKNFGEELNEKKNEIAKLREDIERDLQKEKEININLKNSLPMSGAAKLKDYENKIAQNKKEIEKLKQGVYDIEKENGKMKETIYEYGKDIEILKSAVAEREKRISEIANECANFKKSEENGKSEIKDKANKIEALESEIAKLNNLMISDNSETAEKIENKEKVVNEYKHLLETLTQLKEADAKKYEDVINKKDGDITSMQVQVSNLEKEIDRLSKTVETKNDLLIKQKEPYDKEILALKGKIDLIIKESADFKDIIRSKDKDISKFQAEIQSLTHEKDQAITKLSQLIRDKDKEIFSLNSNQKENEGKIKELTKMFANTHKEKADEATDYQAKINKLTLEKNKEIKDLQNQLDMLNHKTINENNDLNEKLSAVSQSKEVEIKNLNERFIMALQEKEIDIRDLKQQNEMLAFAHKEEIKQLNERALKNKEKEIEKLNETMRSVKATLANEMRDQILKKDNEIKQLLENSKLYSDKSIQKDIHREAIDGLQEENKRLRTLFNECTHSIFEAIKSTQPQILEEDNNIDHESISINIGANIEGGNNNVMLLDSKNSNEISNSLTPSNMQDEDIIRTAVEMFKKYNNGMNEAYQRLEQEKSDIMTEMHRYKLMAETYKQTLEDNFHRIHNSSDEPKNCHGNIYSHALTVEDLINNNNNSNTKEENALEKSHDKELEELSAANAELKNKLQEKEDELLQNKEMITKLMKMNSTATIANLTNAVPQEKLDLVIKQYISEQEKCTLLEKKLSDVRKQISEIEKENALLKQYHDEGSCVRISKSGGDKKNRELTLGDNEEMPSEGVEEKGGSKHGKRDEPSYIAMLNQRMNESCHVKTQHSGMSGSNRKNDSNIQEILLEKKDLEEKEQLLFEQLQTIKFELRETREKYRKALEENETLRKKASEQSSRTESVNTDIFGVLKNALEKLIIEITLTSKIKEFLTVIMRVVGYTDEEISTIYQSKEKKKGIFKLFK